MYYDLSTSTDTASIIFADKSLAWNLNQSWAQNCLKGQYSYWFFLISSSVDTAGGRKLAKRTMIYFLSNFLLLASSEFCRSLLQRRYFYKVNAAQTTHTDC